MVDFLIIGTLFLIIFALGRIIEKIHLPWLFSALIIGIIISYLNKDYFLETDQVSVLSELGFYFLLFIIGFELKFGKLKNNIKEVAAISASTVLANSALIAIFLHYAFSIDFFISLVVGLSFATIGEEVLVPILDKFKLIEHRVGQTLLGIGVVDDIIDVATIIMILSLLSLNFANASSFFMSIIPIIFLFLATPIMLKYSSKEKEEFKVLPVESMLVVMIALLFVFIGIGKMSEAQALSAIAAGFIFRNFIPKEKIAFIEKEIKSIAYGFFAPFFFLSVGVSVNISSVLYYIPFIVVIFILSIIGKFLPAFYILKNKFNIKESLIISTGIMVRFGTGLILIKLLFDKKIISEDLYSMLISTNIIITVLVPIIFSLLVRHLRKKNYGYI